MVLLNSSLNCAYKVLIDDFLSQLDTDSEEKSLSLEEAVCEHFNKYSGEQDDILQTFTAKNTARLSLASRPAFRLFDSLLP